MAPTIREEWLQKAIALFEKRLFKQRHLTIPRVKVSVGFPYGSRGTKRVGEHWNPDASEDKKGSIFIHPILSDSLEVLATLVHELVHSVVGNAAGHGREFRQAALKVGLKGPMRHTTAGPILIPELKEVIKILGPYPHSKLNPGGSPVKKQTTRMYKMECLECGYVARAARKYILYSGTTICPCNHTPMDIDPVIYSEEDTA